MKEIGLAGEKFSCRGMTYLVSVTSRTKELVILSCPRAALYREARASACSAASRCRKRKVTSSRSRHRVVIKEGPRGVFFDNWRRGRDYSPPATIAGGSPSRGRSPTASAPTHMDVQVSRRPWMAESDRVLSRAPHKMCKCRGAQGCARAAAYARCTGCTSVAEAMDGRERPARVEPKGSHQTSLTGR